MNEACLEDRVRVTRWSAKITKAEGEICEDSRSLVSCKEGTAAQLNLGSEQVMQLEEKNPPWAGMPHY